MYVRVRELHVCMLGLGSYMHYVRVRELHACMLGLGSYMHVC